AEADVTERLDAAEVLRDPPRLDEGHAVRTPLGGHQICGLVRPSCWLRTTARMISTRSTGTPIERAARSFPPEAKIQFPKRVRRSRNDRRMRTPRNQRKDTWYPRKKPPSIRYEKIL